MVVPMLRVQPCVAESGRLLASHPDGNVHRSELVRIRGRMLRARGCFSPFDHKGKHGPQNTRLGLANMCRHRSA